MLLAGGCATAGCSTATRATELFDGRRFLPRPSPHHRPRRHTATPLPGGGVLLAGGFEREGAPPLASAEIVRAGEARPAAELREGRGGHAAATLDQTLKGSDPGLRSSSPGGLGADGLLRSAEVYRRAGLARGRADAARAGGPPRR